METPTPTTDAEAVADSVAVVQLKPNAEAVAVAATPTPRPTTATAAELLNGRFVPPNPAGRGRVVGLIETPNRPPTVAGGFPLLKPHFVELLKMKRLEIVKTGFDCSRTCPTFEAVDVCRFNALFRLAGVSASVSSVTVSVAVEFRRLGALTAAVESLGGRVLGFGDWTLYEAKRGNPKPSNLFRVCV